MVPGRSVDLFDVVHVDRFGNVYLDVARSAVGPDARVEVDPGTGGPVDRLLRACGFRVDVALAARPAEVAADPAARGRELVEVLELAEMFPARHHPTLPFPRFGERVPV